jgi:cytochrome P450
VQETTSLALSYAVYALASNVHLQERVAAELFQVVQYNKETQSDIKETNASLDPTAHAGHLSLDDVEKLDLTRSVFLEAMRMWPPVTPAVALVREAHAPFELGGYSLPKGIKVMFNIWSMHHDPVQFPEPYTFRPERHMPGSEEAEKRHPFAFIPFGVGPRKCVGWRYVIPWIYSLSVFFCFFF